MCIWLGARCDLERSGRNRRPGPFPFSYPRRSSSPRAHGYAGNQNRSSSFSLVCTHGAQSLSRCVGFSANANTRTMRAVHYSPWTASALSLFRMNVLARVESMMVAIQQQQSCMHSNLSAQLWTTSSYRAQITIIIASRHSSASSHGASSLASTRAQASMPTICCLARHATSEKAGSRSDAR